MTERLTNQLGTGAFDPVVERQMLDEGIQFASNFTTPHGTTFIVACLYPDIHQRYTEQIAKLYAEANGLPARFRMPTVQPVPTL